MELTETQKEILNGSMLGDGCLVMHKGAKNPYYQVLRKFDDKEYLDWEFEHFKDLCNFEKPKARSVYDHRTNKTYNNCYFRTKHSEILLPEYIRWYPDRKKSVPKDLLLTPLTIAIWLADDGHVNIYKNKKEKERSYFEPKSIHMKFSTDGFKIDDVEFLKSMLESRYNSKFSICRSDKPEQFNIRCFNDTSRILLRDIDNVFPPLKRKSDIWRNCPVSIFYEKPNCIRCGCSELHSYGRNKKGVKMYKCKKCNRTFLESYERPMKDDNGKWIK